MIIDEAIGDDGSSKRAYLEAQDDGSLAVRDDDGFCQPISRRAVIAVLCRYGMVLERGVSATGSKLPLDEEASLQMLRFHARVDAAPRDYVVLHRKDAEPIAAIATTVAAALRHLALAGRREP